MSTFEALILGLIQGIAEFLPISSSGHIELARQLFHHDFDDKNLMTIALHGGTVLSSIIILWSEIKKLAIGSVSFKWNPETRLLLKIFIAVIPIGIVGVFFRDAKDLIYDNLFRNNTFILGIMFILTATFLLLTNYVKPVETIDKEDEEKEITYVGAFLIGIAQAVSGLFRGFSRSGATVSTGILLGFNRAKVAKFSFLIVILPILGENLLDLFKGEFAHSTVGTTALLVGFLTAFIVGLFACKMMINIVKNGKLIYFAYYCMLIGLSAIFFSIKH